MEPQAFYHALNFRNDLCIGCTHCMKACPTEAIRIKGGKATLFENRCVDCGECFRVCPVCAVEIEHDDFEKIFHYKVRVALVPAVFIGQFTDDYSTEQIYSELMNLGFTHIYEVEHAVEVLLPEMEQYMWEHRDSRPLISSFCPAIVRLIQVKFPALTENIVLLKPPVDIAAIYNRKKFMDEGFVSSDIGLFYITPCAAKVVAVRSPVAEKYSEIDGVIHMNFIYNKVLTGLKQEKDPPVAVPGRQSVKDTGIVWSLTRGEAANATGRSLAVDGIHNVIEFLEKLENEEDPQIDFIELRACDESCAGGVLTSWNRFLTAERLHIRADAARKKVMHGLQKPGALIHDQEYIKTRMVAGKISPRSMMKLDEDMAEALKKMKKVHELLIYLPGVDCGGCGSPSCEALAQDVVQGRASIAQCIFVQRTLEGKGVFTREESAKILRNTWGDVKFNRKWELKI